MNKYTEDKSLLDAALAVAVVATIVSVIYLLMPLSQQVAHF